ncbi:MAG: hypothetical protein ACRYG7_05690 [Janthinobacterium lividum]
MDKNEERQPWVTADHMLVGGHSEGSTIIAQLVAVPGLVSRAST